MKRLLFPCAALVAACSSASGATDAPRTDSPTTQPSGDLPCAVDTVLAQNCRSCHGETPLHGAPMSLVTLADFLAPAPSDPSKKVFERISGRIHDDARPMPPPPNARLTDDASAALDDWIASGAPAGDACTTKPNAPAETKPLSCAPDLHMAPTSPWSMPKTTDDVYVCYGFDVTTSEKRHVIGIAPKIDNPKIVHHLLLFQTDTSVSSVPAPCGMTASSQWRVVYGWAPGGGNFEFPPEAGYPQESTTHYVVQVHYNNLVHATGQEDASGFDFCTTNELRPNDADSLVFGTTNFDIPPRSSLDIDCDVTLPASMPSVHAFAAFPHMHQLGSLISTTKMRDGTDLGTRTNWDFQNQFYSPIDATLGGGDVVRTRCAWQNPGTESVSFGERTEDEMCFSFTLYWPRITSGASWLTPTVRSKCSPH